MKLERVKLQNFKPYYQTEKIEFDPDDDEPLTLVRGQNDIGKTALLEGIKFCLYGFDVSGSQQARDQCINRKAAVEGLGQTSVTLKVSHDGETYRIVRGHHFDQVADSEDREAIDRFMKIIVAPDTDQEEVFIDTNEDDEIGDGENFVSDLLPKETVRFFMFDGDRIDQFASKLQESNPDVKNAIELILGIREIQNAIQDLDDIAIDHYESEYNSANSEADEYRDKKEERKEIAENLEDIEDDLDELRSEISETEQERADIRQKLAEAADLEDKYEQQAKSRAELDGLDDVPNAEEILDEATIEDVSEDGSVKEQIRQVRLEQQELYNNFGPALAVVAGKTLEDDLPDESSTIPEAIREILRERSDDCLVCGQSLEVDTDGVDEVDDDEEECTLCGRPFSIVRDDLHEQLEEVKQDATDDAIRLSETIDEILDLEDELGLSNQVIEQKFSALAEKYSDLEARREKLETRISRLENELDNAMDQTERQSLRDRRDQLESQLERLRVQLGETNSELQNTQSRLRKIDSQLDEVEGATERESHYKTLMDASNQTQSVFNGTKNRFVDRQRNQVEREASELFMELTNKSDVYDGLDIDNEYRLRIKVGDEIRDISEQDPSQGARQIIAYAFNAGIARSTNREAPFIIDTPTGRLDDEHKDELLKKLPEFGEQVIVLYQPRELTTGDIEEFKESDLVQNHYEISRGAVAEVSTISRISDAPSVGGDN
jgi:DNA repair exonuclease SbcCD ATPase subunit